MTATPNRLEIIPDGSFGKPRGSDLLWLERFRCWFTKTFILNADGWRTHPLGSFVKSIKFYGLIVFVIQ